MFVIGSKHLAVKTRVTDAANNSSPDITVKYPTTCTKVPNPPETTFLHAGTNILNCENPTAIPKTHIRYVATSKLFIQKQHEFVFGSHLNAIITHRKIIIKLIKIR
uniref:Uncharacterized protein n=1 Tax=Pectinophora gossypiella TaxID=13191 RepID=A0A1E1W7Q4_PECGO